MYFICRREQPTDPTRMTTFALFFARLSTSAAAVSGAQKDQNNETSILLIIIPPKYIIFLKFYDGPMFFTLQYSTVKNLF
jgi:hypothetical protein